MRTKSSVLFMWGHDLDLNPVTLILEFVLDISEDLSAKTKFVGQGERRLSFTRHAHVLMYMCCYSHTGLAQQPEITTTQVAQQSPTP